MGKKWYVVVVGSKPGIYNTWIECKGVTKDIRGAVFESFETEEEAVRVYDGAVQRGEVEVVERDTGPRATPAKKTRHRTFHHQDEFDIGQDGDIFRSGVLSQRTNWIYADTAVQSRLHSPSRTLPPSPPTGVTQYVELEDTPRLQQPSALSPRVTVEDTSYTASPLLPNFRPVSIRRVAPSSSMMHEEKKSPRGLRRQESAPASFETGARYPTIEEVRSGQGLDPRIMIPPARIFDPANVKPRPRASSNDSARGMRPGNGEVDAGSMSPRNGTRRIVPDLRAVHCLEDDEDSSISSLPQRQLADKGKSRALAYAATEVFPIFSRIHLDKRQSFSEYSHHIQEVYTADRPEHRNTVIVRCPVGSVCCHGQCGNMSASTITRGDGGRAQSHVVEVSPVLPSVSSTREMSPYKANASKPVARISDASSGQSVSSFLGLSHSPQVPHRGYAAESDVRSPYARGTRVPSGLSELSIFGRPSPPIQSSPAKNMNRNVLMVSRA